MSKKRQKFFVQKSQFYARINHLKSKGQRLEVVEKVREFIDSNLDDLCNSSTERKLKNVYGENKSKKIEALLAQKNGYTRKLIIRNQLLTYAEGLLKERRDRLRFGRVNSLIEKTRTKLPMRQRDMYIEGKIDSDFHYFSQIGYKSGLEKDGINYEELRAALSKKNELLKKRNLTQKRKQSLLRSKTVKSK